MKVSCMKLYTRTVWSVNLTFLIIFDDFIRKSTYFAECTTICMLIKKRVRASILSRVRFKDVTETKMNGVDKCGIMIRNFRSVFYVMELILFLC